MKRSAPPSTEERPTKRAHISSKGTSLSHLSDEVILHILAHLDATSLAQVQLVNTHCLRIARDNQLWKSLFLRDHPPSHLRSLSRPAKDSHHPHPPLDWRWVYRLSQNWATGFTRSSSLTFVSLQHSVVPHPHSVSDGIKTLPFAQSRLQLLGPYIALSHRSSPTARILLLPTQGTPIRLVGEIQLFSGSDEGPGTCLVPDTATGEGVAEWRFAAFSQRGSIAVFSLPLHPPSDGASSIGIKTHSWIPPGGVARQIKTAVFHSQLLVTLSSNFTLHLYHVPPSAVSGTREVQQLNLVHSLYSFSSFPPAALSLSSAQRSKNPPQKLPEEKFKLTLHHLLPAYPAHWVPTSHQFLITLPSLPSHSMASNSVLSPSANRSQPPKGDIVPSQSWTVSNWLPSALPEDSPVGSDEDGTGPGDEVGKETRVRKLRGVGGVAGDGKVVAVLGDGAVNVYRLPPRSVHLLHASSLPLPIPLQPPSATTNSTSTRAIPQALTVHAQTGRCIVATESGVVVYDLSVGGKRGRREGVMLPLPSGGVHDTKLGEGSAASSSKGQSRRGTVCEVRTDQSRIVGLWEPNAGESGEESVMVWDFDC
ncbi:hypothetical protein DACRYDRAFT_105056 [Dacryopinax primogenitus]|uniref:F-box domain-containing protein n=1 Tax=Dacryopinax primogenitus (strain DJM 731) TaxID=1858805 RepID=M5G6Z5_DACPD|nr:uncharacterized protein DACRYDRAFT_105056 [Dacryopinax primogenitus]EJU03985.1 hypothetical protein DACRYDRAFT_105056 [Dacryopinax primogenitus]